MLKLVLAPGAIDATWIAVTTCPVTLKLHPLPEPDTNVSPAGKVSLTVVAPVVGALPMLLTVKV